MSEQLTPEREAEIRARVAAATPGAGSWRGLEDSWTYIELDRREDGGPYLVGPQHIASPPDHVAIVETEADAIFIQDAAADMKLLLAELVAVRRDRDEALTRATAAEAVARSYDAQAEALRKLGVLR